MSAAKDLHKNTETFLRRTERACDALTKAAWEQLLDQWQRPERRKAEHVARRSSRRDLRPAGWRSDPRR